MKIKAKNPRALACVRLIVPVDGLITIDSEGEVEVSAACAEALVNGTSDWEYAESGAPATGVDAEEVEETESEEEIAEPNEREKFSAELENMTVAQMKDLCREGGFPEDEWKSLKKATLAAYLLDKFDSAAANEIAEEEEELEEEEPLEEEEK